MWTVAVVAPLSLASCVLHVQPLVPTDASPAPEAGYVGVLDGGDGDSYGFGLMNEASASFTIPLQEPLALTRLPVGTYHVTYFAVWGGDGKQKTRGAVRVDHPIARPFDLRAGQVVILGRWRAMTTYGHDDLRTIHFTLTPLPLSAAEADQAVLARYPAFTDVRVSCLVCR